MLTNIRKKLRAVFTHTELLQLSLAVYLGTVLQKLLESIVTNIFMPILDRIVPVDILDKKIQLIDVDINIGEIISNLISMIIALSLAYTVILLVKKV